MKRLAFPRLAADHVFVVFFLLIATSPVWWQVLNSVGSENGTQAALPPLATWPDALAFPRSLGLYLSEHLIQRSGLVHLVIAAKINVFKETAEPVPGVIIGSDGWLYYTEGQQGYASSTGVYTAADLDKMQHNVDNLQAQLKAQSIPLVVVIAPDKQSVYPEYLPVYARRSGADTGLDQIVSYFKQHASTPLLDLRAPLTAAKTQFQVYYRTDSHWTSSGALVAWGEIKKLLATEIPGLERTERLSAFTPISHRFSGDLAGMLTMKDIWGEDTIDWAPPLLPPEEAGSTKPRLAIFSDSFAQNLLPFLNNDFSHVRFDQITPVCVDFRSVQEEKPAAVIWLMAERNQQSLWCSPRNVPGQ